MGLEADAGTLLNIAGDAGGGGGDSDDGEDDTMGMVVASWAVPEIAGDADDVDDMATVQAAGRRRQSDPVFSPVGRSWRAAIKRRTDTFIEKPDQEQEVRTNNKRNINALCGRPR